jgi:two-component system, NarL family, sensor histidine kinase UhpB
MPNPGRKRIRQIAKMLSPSTWWHGRSVRTQLLIIIGAVNLLAATLAGGIWILNTRSATHAEIESSLEIAQGFAQTTIRDLASQGHLDQLSERLPQELKSLRHVRLLLMIDGKLNMLAPVSVRGEHLSRWAPKWFAALVGPSMSGRSIRVVSASRADPVIIIGEPADEIAEAWRDFSSLAVIWLTLDAIVLVILYVVLGRVLHPLASLARGMQSLKGGRYATRLKPSRVKEIALITDRFNGLAGNLDSAREENSQLYRKLISTQEQVRRDIAHELHDEAGACLFGIAANASSIRRFADRLESEPTEEIGGHVGEILSNADRLKAMNRSILKQLRPGPIGQVSLSQLIKELLGGLQKTHRETQILATVGDLARSYGEGCDLTLYRCVQEGVTAAVRKGAARTIYVDIDEHKTAGRGARKQDRLSLRATLRFDGSGFPASKPKDLTLATMAERVRALGGACTIKSSASKGTTIRIDIPIKRMPAKTEELDLVGSRS